MEQSYYETWDYCIKCIRFKIIHSDDKLCNECRLTKKCTVCNKTIKTEICEDCYIAVELERDIVLERLQNAENEIGDLKTRINELEGK